MIETDLEQYLVDNLDPALWVSWDQVNSSISYEDGNISVSFFKLPSGSSNTTPSYLDQFQITVRGLYLDAVQSQANSIIKLFHLWFGVIGSYRVAVDDIANLGQVREETNLVSVVLQLGLKYTGL